MKLVLVVPISLAAIVGHLFLPALLGQDLTPLLGMWRVNVEKSAFAAGVPYRRVTCRIEARGGGLRIVYDIVGTRGGVTHWEWTGNVDGKDYTLQGVEAVVTNAYTRIDDRTYTTLVKEDGRATTVSKITISPDGKVMTVMSTTPAPGGQQVVNTVVYGRS